MSTEKTPETTPKKKRGFAAMSREQVIVIASRGGKAAHAAGTAHQFTTDEARAAGFKGGVAPHKFRGRTPVHSGSGAPSSSPPPSNLDLEANLEVAPST